MDREDIITFITINKQKLADDFGVIQIGLFGSYAKDVPQKNSDIDIVVKIVKDKKTLSNFLNLKRFLEQNLLKNVDLGTIESLKPIVRDNIAEDIIYV